jgi:hypothetical protein
MSFIIIILWLFFYLLYLKWFPKTNKLRVNKRYKGKILYYRAEVYRLIFGWTPFYCNVYNGEIYFSDNWNISLESCERSIELYKQLHNIN